MLSIRRGVGLAFLSLLAFALIIAMMGWLGERPKTIVNELWLLLAEFVAAYYDLFERLGRVLAPLFAIGSGAYAIYQKWYYAGRNLHLRLQEFLLREEKRLKDADKVLEKNAIRPGPAQAFQSPLFPNAALRAALRTMNWGTVSITTLHRSSIDRAEEEVQRATTELEEQLSLWDAKKSDYQRRLIQALLVKGAIAVGRAATIRARGGDDREENQNALTAFQRAAHVDPQNPDPLALEFAAHQRVRLGDYNGAYQDFDKLLDVVADKRVDTARILKFQAEIQECRSEAQPNIHAATQLLNSAIQIFPPALGRSDVIEAAELHEMQGRVRAKRPNWDWDDAALTSYTNAEGLYLQVNGPEAAAGLLRIAEQRRKILARRTARPNGESGSTTSALISS